MTDRPAKDLRTEIERDITHHIIWESRDFSVAQLTVWVGLLSSTAASLHAAGAIKYDGNTFIPAVIAAIPGAVIVLEKTFKFTSRAAWHAQYRARLNGLFRKIRDGNADIAKVSEERSALEIEMENNFPAMPQTTEFSTKQQSR